MADSDNPIDEQIQFARHNFENHQALIRFSDTKAAAMVTLFIFLAASALQVVKDAAQVVQFTSCLVGFASLVFLGACGALLLGFFVCIWSVQVVLRPRGARFYKNPTPGTDLLWQEHVVAHGSNSGYLEAVQSAKPELLLKNLTDQVFELAHISQEKMAGLQAGRKALLLGFCCWVLVVTSGLILLRLR